MKSFISAKYYLTVIQITAMSLQQVVVICIYMDVSVYWLLRMCFVSFHVLELSKLLPCCLKHYKIHGFPIGSYYWGGHFGQNGQKLHENHKINIFVAKQQGDIGRG